MTRRILPILLLSVAFPLSAGAQSSPAAPAADQGQASGTNQNNAHGGINDARPTQEGAKGPGSGLGSDNPETSGAAQRQALERGKTEGPFVIMPASTTWRVSDLRGTSVYSAEGKDIGSINDVLVSQDGSVNAVIVGVGGFLGIGQKDVAIDMKALQLGPGATQEDANAYVEAHPKISGETTASTEGRGDPQTTGPDGNNKGGATATVGGGAAGAARSGGQTGTGEMVGSPDNKPQIGGDGLPDRIIVNVSREDLEKAPEFRPHAGQQ